MLSRVSELVLEAEEHRKAKDWPLMVLALREAAALAEKPLTFEQVWAAMEAKGYRYGQDALEGVRFGWKLAHGQYHGLTQVPDAGGKVDDGQN